jgi:hypothetical protein
MIEAVIESLINSITTLVLGKAITFTASKRVKRISTPQVVKEISEETSLILGENLAKV